MTRAELQDWLATHLARALGVDPKGIALDMPFQAMGLESVDLLEMSGELEDVLGRTVDPTIIYEFPTIIELADGLTAGPRAAPERRERDVEAESVAIVGIACRLPGADGPTALWEALRQGLDLIGEVPEDRWDIEAFFDPEPLSPGKMNTRWGGFLDDVDGFDHDFFGISSAEAAAMDPQQRLLLELGWQALEDANIPPQTLRGQPVGVFVGISHNDYEAIHLRDLRGLSSFSGTGNALSIAANRISYQFDFRGPSLAIDTACSSSLYAVHLAMMSLRAGECDYALAGGVNVLLSPDVTVSFSKAGMMSPDGRCKSFDASGNGYVRGEGAGLLLLRPLKAAVQAGDRIYAVIRGSAVSQDGRSNGLHAPNPAAQEAVLRAAYADSGVDPQQVSYVEAHGTGTRLGDPIEARALGRVVGDGRGRAPCLVGSIKSNIGHLEAAAGVAGLIKGALVVQHQLAPPTVHFHSPNPHIDFEGLGLRVVADEQPIAPNTYVGVSAFGFGGANAHVVLQSAPEPAQRAQVSDDQSPSVMLVPLSAHTPTALEALRRRWVKSVESSSQGGRSIAELASTAALGRQHLTHRLAVVAEGREDLVARLRARSAITPRPARAPAVCLLFPGQGVQYQGMALELALRFKGIDQSLRESDRLVRRLAGFSILDEIASGARLTETAIAQPAIVAVQLALAEFLKTVGIQPQAVIGHSAGEIAAACVAGTIGTADALELAVLRGQIMSEASCEGGMLAVLGSATVCEELLELASADLEIAAVNGPEATVVSGAKSEIARFAEECRRRGVDTRLLNVDVAGHSRGMEAAAARLGEAIPGHIAGRASIPLFSTVTGVRFEDPIEGEYWCRNLRERVRFHDACQAAAAAGFDDFVEVGPDSVLLPALRSHSSGTNLHVPIMSRRAQAQNTLLEGLQALFEAGADLNWAEIYPGGNRGATLPGMAWHRDGALRKVRLTARAQLDLASRPGPSQWFGERLGMPEGYPLQLWQSEVSAQNFPWIDDHKVLGVPVFPAAAMMCWMTAAAAEASGVPIIRLRAVRIHSPLILGTETAALITKVDVEHHRVSLQARDKSDPEWRLIAQASFELIAEDGPLPDRLDAGAISHAEARCLDPVDREQLYDALTAAGLEYGQAFRSLTDIRRGPGEAVGRLVSTEALHGVPPGLAPWLLDSAFHAVAAALDLNGAGPTRFVPSGAESVTLHPGRIPTAAWVRVLEEDVETERLKADVVLYDRADQIVGAVQGLSLSPMPVSLVARLSEVRLATRLHLYSDKWRPRRATPQGASSRRIVVLLDKGRKAELLARGLEAAGHEVIRSERPEVEALLAQAEAIGGDRGLQAVMASLSPAGGPVDAIVHCWAFDGHDGGLEPLTSDMSAFARLVRGIGLFGSMSAPRLWILTSGALAAGAKSAAVNPSQGTLWGLGLTTAFELPDLKCSRLDLDPSKGVSEMLDEVVGLIGDDPDDSDQFALRDATILVRELAETAAQDNRIQLREDGTYVITGGWGALGLTVARALVAAGARRRLLIGRSRPDASAEIAIEALRAGGAIVELARADLSRREEVRDALATARAMGPLLGVVHSAGVINDGPLIDLTQAQLDEAMEGKARGALHLHDLSQDDALEFFVAFSSAAANLGTFGQGAYIAANAYLSSLIEYRRARGLAGLSIEWGPWAERGMASERVKPIPGVLMIDPADGGEVFLRLLQSSESRIMVLPYRVETLVHLFPATLGVSIFRELMGEDPWYARLAARAATVTPRPALSAPYQPPETELETLIVGIWQRALRVEPVGVRDPFFELGGDSVFAGQVLSEINRTLGVVLDSEAAFADLTIQTLARLADEALVAAVEALSDDDVEAALGADA